MITDRHARLTENLKGQSEKNRDGDVGIMNNGGLMGLSKAINGKADGKIVWF